jgi:ribulose-bisphosphate carboxylase small chain
MRITQGTFSFLPDFTDAEIRAQIDYALAQGWAISVEYTDDPHPRNYYWEMWGNPLFDLANADGAMAAVSDCRAAHPHIYVRVSAFDSTRGFETTRLSFIVNRPADEPGFVLRRQEAGGRNLRYTIDSYATQAPEGRRYE